MKIRFQIKKGKKFKVAKRLAFLRKETTTEFDKTNHICYLNLSEPAREREKILDLSFRQT